MHDLIAEAADEVVVDHSDRLHEGVADGRPNEAEPSTFEVHAHRVGFRRVRRDLFHMGPRVLPRRTIHKLPNVAVERSELGLHGEKRSGILDGRFNLETVPNNSGIRKKTLAFSRVVTRNHTGVESRKGAPIAISLFENCDPAEASLCAFEGQHFKQLLVIVRGNTPLVIVIGHVIDWIGVAPRTSGLRACHNNFG